MPSNDYTQIKFDTTGLEKIITGLKQNIALHVGVLGNNDSRSSGASNATIGAKHEFGIGLHKRSFLKEPLTIALPEEIDLAKNEISKEISLGDQDKAIKKIGVLCESIIQDAFDTGGFGRWEPLRPATIAKKGHDKILIETNQLRRSISSRIVKNDK